MNWFRSAVRGEAEALVARAKAAKDVRHAGVKGGTAEALIAGFLRSALPPRFRTKSGIVIGGDGTASGQVDVIVYDGSLALQPGRVNAVWTDSVYGTVEVKTTLASRQISKAMRDASKVKRVVPSGGEQLLFADPAEGDLVDVSRLGAPLKQCTLVAFSSGVSLTALAKHWYRHFLDVPFGEGLDGFAVLDAGHIGLASWLPQSGDPVNALTPQLNIAPFEPSKAAEYPAVLLFPDVLGKDWARDRPIRVGPPVPLAPGARLYITINACGLDALGIWFRMLWGFVSGQLRMRGEPLPESLGPLSEAFPKAEIDSVLPLAIAADIHALRTEGPEYAAEMVGQLLTQE